MSDSIPKVPFANSYWVVAGQVLAGEYPGDADSDAARKRLAAILHAGIRTFIDLTDEDEINEDAKPIPLYRALLRELAEEQRAEVTYARIPIPDRGVPSVWTMQRILDLIDQSVGDENPVYVHCWAGRGRTGAVVGCYLKRHELASEQNVVPKIMEMRKAMPNGRDSSPHTPPQVRMVQTWKSGA